MRTTLVLGFACIGLFLGTDVRAEEASDLRQEAYDEGWSSAHNYCEGLRPGTRRGFRGGITEVFSFWCRKGFDGYINNNWSCQTRIRDRGAYREMWGFRRNACM